MDSRITVLSDKQINSLDQVKIHISYDENLTLKELSELLGCINMAINDANRSNGVKDNGTLGRNYASKVTGVNAGSVVLDLIIPLASSLAISVVGSLISERLSKFGKSKRRKDGYPVDITINGDGNIIEVKIQNNSDL